MDSRYPRRRGGGCRCPRQPIPGRVRRTYEFIKAHRDRYSVQALCRILDVAPSGYYEWLKQPLSNRAQEDARLLRLIRASFSGEPGHLWRAAGLPGLA